MGQSTPVSRRELEDPLVQAHQQVEAVHVVEAGVVVGRRVVIERLARHGVVLPDHPRLLEDRRPAAVDRPVGPLGVTAVEVDAQPPAQPRTVRRDVQPRSRGARRRRLLEDVDRGEDARFPQGQGGHEAAHAAACDECSHRLPPALRLPAGKRARHRDRNTAGAGDLRTWPEPIRTSEWGRAALRLRSLVRIFFS